MTVNVTQLQNDLANFTGCTIQHDGWSCNSCFHSLDGELKLKEDFHEYWLAVLFYRGDYDDFDWEEYKTEKYGKLINELMEVLNGQNN